MIFNKKRHVSQMKLNLYSKPSYESGFIYNDSLEQKDNDKRHELYIKSCKYLIDLAETLFPNAPSVRREIDGALFSFRPNYANDEQVNNNSSENILTFFRKNVIIKRIKNIGVFRMKLVSWNVNGFRAVLGKGFSEIFDNFDADIFCLQEAEIRSYRMYS